MARQSSEQPTEVELEILGILWAQGKSTARDIHNALSKNRETNYSTTVKMLAVMFNKQLVKRNESTRPIRFSAAQSQTKTQSRLLKNLVQKAYDGSFGSLVLQALSSKKTSTEELEKIRNLLDKIEKDTQ